MKVISHVCRKNEHSGTSKQKKWLQYGYKIGGEGVSYNSDPLSLYRLAPVKKIGQWGFFDGVTAGTCKQFWDILPKK